MTAADIDSGYLHRAASELGLAAARWAWDGTVNDAGHYRFRRAARSGHEL